MRERPRVVVYVKPGCTLCGPLWSTVEKLREDLGFDLEKVDIGGDPVLLARHAHEVPVVLINGRKAFKGRLNEAELRKKLKRARAADRAFARTKEDPATMARFDASRSHESEGTLESLDALDPEPFVPPRPIAAFLVLAALFSFGYFLFDGLREAREGRGRLAGRLLKIEPRNETPARFLLESQSGGRVSLDDFPGKVVFLNFWATWCPPCVEEMPSMIRLYDRMKDHPRFVMLAVSADEAWDPVRQFFSDRPSPGFKVLLDPGGKIAKDYGTTMFPETYVIADGQIVGFIEGPRDWDQWFADEYLRAWLD